MVGFAARLPMGCASIRKTSGKSVWRKQDAGGNLILGGEQGWHQSASL
jgi:uncharacterized protein YceK